MNRLLFSKTTFSVLVLLLSSPLVFSQYRYDWRTELDRIIERNDSLSLVSQQTFTARNLIRVDRSFVNDIDVRETWRYTLHKGKVVLFDVRYLIDSTEYVENYYLDDNRLICMETYATEFYNPANANFLNGEILFLVNDQVKLHVSIGDKKNSLKAWRLERRPMEKFLERYAALKRNLRDVSVLDR